MQEKVFYQLILFPGWLLLAMLHGAGRPGQALPWVVTVREQRGKYGLRIYFYFIDLRERDINLLFLLLKHSLADSSMFAHQRPNPQPWHIRVTLSLLSNPARVA